MLQKLNERIQGVVAWIVIVLVAITFTLFGVDYYLQAHQTTIAAADVNGKSIPKQWLELSYQRLRQGRDPADMNVMPEKQIKEKILDDLVVRQVSLDSAEEHGFGVSAQQADNAIVNIPQFQKDGKFSSDRYQQVLSSALFTPQTFQQEVRQGMILNQQRFAFMGTTFVLPNEIKQYVKYYAQTRDYQYAYIPISKFIDQVNVTDEQVRAYFDSHKKEFSKPKQVVINYVELSMAQIREKVRPSDDAILRYYEDNQDDYLKPAQWKVDRLSWAIPKEVTPDELSQIKLKAQKAYESFKASPEQFDSYAKAQTIENLGVVSFGPLPWISAGSSDLDKEFSKFGSAGSLLAPIQSETEIAIYKLTDYKPAAVKPFQEVRSEVKEQLIAEIAQANYARELETLTDTSYQNPDSLLPIADSLGLKIKETKSFSRQGGDDPITQNPQVLSAVFSHDVNDLENNSAPIQIDNENVIVLRVTKHIPAQLEHLADVSDSIKKILKNQAAEAMASKLGQELENIKNPQEEALFLENNHIKWKHVKNMTHDSEMTLPAVNELAFTLSSVGHRSMLEIDSAYVVLELNNIANGSLKSLDKEQVASITQQIEANDGVLSYDLYINQLVSQAKIVKHI